jgi:histidinol-phosphate phosphatase family protein
VKSGISPARIRSTSVVARGECTFADIEQIHGRLVMKLREQGAFLDGIFYCPHHPERGFPGEVAGLKVVCGCRKPNPGLVVAALRRLPIDLTRSAIVGDSQRDIGLAQRLGLPGYFISPTSSPTQLDPGITRVADLAEAVRLRLAADPH